MSIIKMPTSKLKAVAMAMACKKEIRFFLQGVYVEHNGAETRLTATDGHRLMCGRILHGLDQRIDPINFIIPAGMIKDIERSKTKEINVELQENGIIYATAQNAKGAISFKIPRIDSVYPDYRRTIPSAFGGCEKEYMPKYLQDALDACSLWEFGRLVKWYHLPIQHGENHSAGGYVIENFMAIIMSLRPSAKQQMPIDPIFFKTLE